MKRFLTSRLFTFILGAVIFSGITAVSAYTLLASNIRYTPSDSTWKKTNGEDITNVKDAIDELYTKSTNKIVFLTASWKGAVSWNSYGFGISLVTNNDYITNNGNSITFKQKCRVKITGLMANTEASKSAPQYRLFHNNQAILSFSNSASADASTIRDITLLVNAGDTFYLNMYGGGKPTYYITMFELSPE